MMFFAITSQGKNSKSEARISKQIEMTEIHGIFFENWKFGFVSSRAPWDSIFELRIF